MPEYRDPERCTRCGGKCCRIYIDGQWEPWKIFIEEWASTFHEDSEWYDVPPMFDPIIIHKNGNEYMIDELKARGINPYACQYLGPEGCLITWERRPKKCRTYRCENWIKEEEQKKIL